MLNTLYCSEHDCAYAKFRMNRLYGSKVLKEVGNDEFCLVGGKPTCLDTVILPGDVERTRSVNDENHSHLLNDEKRAQQKKVLSTDMERAQPAAYKTRLRSQNLRFFTVSCNVEGMFGCNARFCFF